MLRTVRRWAEMLRLDLSADGSIRLDDDDRPLKPIGSFALPVDPPYEAVVGVLVTPHLLRVTDRAGFPIQALRGIDVAGLLRRRGRQRDGQQEHERESRK